MLEKTMKLLGFDVRYNVYLDGWLRYECISVTKKEITEILSKDEKEKEVKVQIVLQKFVK